MVSGISPLFSKQNDTGSDATPGVNLTLLKPGAVVVVTGLSPPQPDVAMANEAEAAVNVFGPSVTGSVEIAA